MTKNEILEAYLNIIYVGPNIYGVKSGAKYYFNKDISELSLAECAFLAGINNSPYSYNPFIEKDYSEKIEKRTKTVLNKMLELGYINQEDFEKASIEVENGLKFDKGSFEKESFDINISLYNTIKNQLIEDFSLKNMIPKEFAANYFALSQSIIYLSEDNQVSHIE